jgi:quinohemoprotein ethanol dehydrogenase
MFGYRWLSPLIAALFAALPGAVADAQGPKVVDNAELGNEADGTDWPAYGRTFSESRFSPLRQINDSNVSRLGLAWVVNLDVTNSITAPVESGGIIYLAAGYSIVHAIRATDGKVLWRYDPKVPEASGQKLRAGWGIRGLALWKDKVYVGTQDGRLLALAAGTGQLVWAQLDSLRHFVRAQARDSPAPQAP